MILQYLFSHPEFFVVWLFSIVYAITVHEFSHAFAGDRLGDQTARSMGRLTLNPLSHLDMFGSIMLLIAGFGWGKPVPFNPYMLRYKRWGPAIISLAGPLSNFISVLIFGILLKVLLGQGIIDDGNLLTLFLTALIQVNAILGLFNLIPIPPLDGSKVLFSALSDRYMNFKMTLERTGPMILIGIIILDSVLGLSLLGSLFNGLINGIFSVFT